MVVKIYTGKWLYSHCICLNLTYKPRATGNQFSCSHSIFSRGNWRKKQSNVCLLWLSDICQKPNVFPAWVPTGKHYQQLNVCTGFSKVASLAVTAVRQCPMPENIKPTTCVHYQAVMWGPRVRQTMLKITVSIIAQLLHQQILSGDLFSLLSIASDKITWIKPGAVSPVTAVLAVRAHCPYPAAVPHGAQHWFNHHRCQRLD